MKERLMTLALKKHKTVRSAAKALGINERTLHTFKDKLKEEKE
jgi:transposase-like protein